MTTTSCQRLCDSVNKHGISWNDVARHMSERYGIPVEICTQQTWWLKNGLECSMPVAVSAIELIAKTRKPRQ